MDEEISQPAEPTEAPAETTAVEAPPQTEEGASSVPAADAETPPAAPDWRKAIDEAPLDELRHHSRIAGIVGSEKPLWQQQWQQQWESQKSEEIAAKARADYERELEELYEKHPVAFAEKVWGERQAAKAKEQLSSLEVNAQKSVATQIGAAFHAIPEWAAIADDPDRLAQLAVALEGKTRDQVLPAWNAKAVDLVAERRAQARFDEWKKTELTREREALRTEITAELLAQGSRPDLARALRDARRGSWEDAPMDSKEFQEGYAREVLRRRG
jgi:hypothetical protein